MMDLGSRLCSLKLEVAAQTTGCLIYLESWESYKTNTPLLTRAHRVVRIRPLVHAPRPHSPCGSFLNFHPLTFPFLVLFVSPNLGTAPHVSCPDLHVCVLLASCELIPSLAARSKGWGRFVGARKSFGLPPEYAGSRIKDHLSRVSMMK
jgi:hypothetical protein